MIISYGASNYFSFKEWFEISFVKNSKNEFDASDYRTKLSRVIGIKGANASGKTNILKALKFIFEFCRTSFKDEPSSSINIESFFGSEEPTEFYIEVFINEVQYRYELTLTDKKVISETIYRKNLRYKKIVHRELNEIKFTTKEFDELKKIKLRDNCSLISAAMHYSIEEMEPLYSFFATCTANISSYSGLHEESYSTNRISKLYNDFSQLFEFCKDIIKRADTGVSDIKMLSYENTDGDTTYTPRFYFENNGVTKSLGYHVQSSGTKMLYNYLWMYKYSLDRQGVLIIDELDIKLHPYLAPFLLNLFNEENAAQIIFSSHNSEIIDYLGKSRTYLVNKENNESFSYRLDEIPSDIIRNDRPIYPAYRDGKIGGIPKL